MTPKAWAVLLAATMLSAPTLAQEAAAPPVTAAAPTGPVTLAATLTGAAELDDGDPDGKGGAKITIDGTRLCYDVDYHRLAPVTMAHIHAAPEGKNGDPVATLKLDADENIKGCLAVSAELAAALIANPKDYYVNVHTEELPKGAIRGQLSK